MITEQLIAWTVLVAVLSLIASGRFRIDLAAVCGLLALGIAGISSPDIIFSGYGNPALATIVTVFFISRGIVDSGLARGIGQSLAKRTQTLKAQVTSIAAVSAILSAFMNNVGAVGLMLPTAVRMAGRSGSCPGIFGLPLAMASILGGSATLIGSAPNIIIASYMLSATGQSFKMFDFAPHGLAMLAIFIVFWSLCKSCGIEPGAVDAKKESTDGQKQNKAGARPDEVVYFAPFATRERKITLAAIVAAIAAVSLGLLHPSYGFGGAAMILIIFRVLKISDAYDSIDLKIVIFLGAMLGIGQVLEHTGALALLSSHIVELAEGISPFWLVVLLIFISSALSNGINNAASAVFMAPLAVGIAAGNSLETGAALMAAAAGANMTLLIPTHQAVLMVMSKAPFSTASFLRFGTIITILCGFGAAAVISLVWQ